MYLSVYQLTTCTTTNIRLFIAKTQTKPVKHKHTSSFEYIDQISCKSKEHNKNKPEH